MADCGVARCRAAERSGRRRSWTAGALAALLASCIAVPGRAQTAAEPASARAGPGQTIIVTGSRLPRANERSASPVQTVTPQEFVLTGVPNVEQTLNQLPQLVGSFTTTSNNPGTGAATLNLRGLGSVRTLVLVNGRRWIASDAGEVPEVDVNTIPAALIRRVDIVTGGASATYGSDAVTGVINFITDQDFTGIRLDARQALTGRGDGRTSSADLSAGTGFADGRGRIVGAVGWLDQAPVQQGARPLSRVALNDGCVVPGTRQPTGASTPVSGPCTPPNVFGLIAGGSPIIPGSRIVGRAFLPVPGSDRLTPVTTGLRFDPSGSALPFNPATDAYNFAPDNYLQVPLRRWSGNLFASFEVAPAVEPYLELAYIETRSPQQLAPVAGILGGGSGTVPVARVNLANPFLAPGSVRILDLSFGVDAQGRRGFIGSPAPGFRANPAFGGDADGVVAFPAVLQSRLDLGPRRRANERQAVRALLGLRGSLGGSWDYDLYVSHSRVDHRVAYQNSGSAMRLQQALLAVRDPATGQVVCIDPSNGCAPANIFGAGNLSAAAADFIRTDPVDLTIVEEQVAEALVRGQLAFLPAGPAGVALGATWRRSAYDFRPDPDLFTGDDLGFQPGTPAAGDTRVFEVFAEARVPLLASAAFFEEVNAELGARWSSYDSVGGVFTWKALLNWTPVPGLRLRGGYQRAVRAPNVRELFEAPSTAIAGVADPCQIQAALAPVRAACIRSGVPADLIGQFPEVAFPVVRSRGNPALDAETADTFTVGATLAPTMLPDLSLTLDYYDIRIAGAIGTFGGGPQALLFGCIAGGGDPASPLCRAVQRGPAGEVAAIDTPTANLEEVRARGLDWQLNWRRALGTDAAGAPIRLDLLLAGTHYFENGFRDTSAIAGLDCAGQFGVPCGNTIGGTATPRWKLYNNVSLGWGGVTASVRHRWFSATRDARTRSAPRFGLPPPVLAAEGAVLEGRHYVDLATTFRITDRFSLTVGVNNFTDAQPAITGFNQVQANTDPSLYDVLGRRFFAALQLTLF